MHWFFVGCMISNIVFSNYIILYQLPCVFALDERSIYVSRIEEDLSFCGLVPDGAERSRVALKLLTYLMVRSC